MPTVKQWNLFRFLDTAAESSLLKDPNHGSIANRGRIWVARVNADMSIVLINEKFYSWNGSEIIEIENPDTFVAKYMIKYGPGVQATTWQNNYMEYAPQPGVSSWMRSYHHMGGG